MATGIILAHSFPQRPTLNGTQQLSLSNILDRLRVRIAHYRPLILPHFQDYDRQHSGTVTHDQFARVLTIVKSQLVASELSLLTQAFLSEDVARVDYRKFLREVDPTVSVNAASPVQYKNEEEAKEFQIIEQNNVFASLQTSDGYMKTPARSVHEIVRDIQQISSMKRANLYDLFNDFDPLRHRSLTREQFRRCLDVAGFELSDIDINTLVNGFVTYQGQVAYDAFERAVSSVHIPQQAELQPSQPAPKARFEPRLDSKSIVSGSQLDILLRRLAYVSSTRRVLIKPAFAASDRQSSGCVTENIFKAVLASLFPAEGLSTDQQGLLIAHFRQGEQVSYNQFCRALAQLEAEYEATITRVDAVTAAQIGLDATTARTDSVMGSPSTLSQPIKNYDLLITSLRDTLAAWRLNIDTAFDDFDRLRRGSVPKPIFYRCLSMCGLRIRAEEIDILAEHYQVTAEGREGQVNYKMFLKDLSFIPVV